MKQLFGTDGIRGTANRYPMTVTMAMTIGRAIARYVKNEGYNCVVIGRDTRISGQMLESALAAGITSEGLDVLTAGVIPTPAVAFLLSDIEGAGAGIVISASHNPWQDNGIKIFKHGGHKLSDEEEESIESMIFTISSDHNDKGEATDRSQSGSDKSAVGDTGHIKTIGDARTKYCDFLKQSFTSRDGHLDRALKIVVDCSNGAASVVAPMVFDDPVMFDASFIFNKPDGKNINDQCGSQHTETLSSLVVKSGADIGLAFDGDADRLIAVDERGSVITGDRILAICAAHAKRKGALLNNRVVSTVMSNIGLSRTLEALEIEHLMTGVGDREVLKVMRESGATMGGEDSGHMIFSQYHTTGDGLLTALRLIEVMVDSGKSLSELALIMKVYPQILMNVEVDASRPDFMAVRSIADEIRAVEAELGADGRVLVRYSGTQPLLRVMVEGPEHDKTMTCCQRICNKIRQYRS